MSFDLLHTDDIRVERCDGTRRGVQRVLDACREERRPYLVIKEQGTKEKSFERKRDNNQDISPTTDETNPNSLDSWFLTPSSAILVPVTMLEEEVYKAEICTYLARKTGAHIILLRANDYGSKAKRNTQRIIIHIQSIAERTGETISYEERVAKSDSFHIHKEIVGDQVMRQLGDQAMILLTASREYGLDDWVFGPPEQYVIRKSLVPVMLVNPRADLFSLCD
ncbi:MAG: universal stress protein [Paludibacteraceae bacterium]|nr:universal stress protein [Paludibacteraceae bacterium]